MFFIALFLIAVCGKEAVGAAASPPHPCQCWPDWTPVKEGNDWYCKEQRSSKSFACNIDPPPTCLCKDRNKIVPLPLGEVNCVGGGSNYYDETNCVSNPEWEAWFNKYPQYRLYH